MKEYETLRTYGKILNYWNHYVSYEMGGEMREESRVFQREVAYTEYDCNGEKVLKGSEDFSNERYYGLKMYRVWTWDGEKYNKGGNRWFEVQLAVTINPKDRRKLCEIARKWFPKAAEVSIR
jgi:hypothetical protein